MYYRRTDPTAGHIMHGMKGLMPSSLPPLTNRPNDLGREKISNALSDAVDT